jgi:predicted acylesterase/phospholipase RssA
MERDVAVVLSGGAVNGVLMELGFLKRLRQSELWPRIGWIYGTSAGALSGTMAALDRLDELERFMEELQPDETFRPHRLWRLPLLGTHDYRLPATVAERLDDPVELARALQDAPIEVRVFVTDVTGDRNGSGGHPFELMYSSRETQPERMAEAVLASAAISGLVLPLRVGDRIATDGAWVRNFPLGHAYDHPEVTTIVSFRFESRVRGVGGLDYEAIRRKLNRFRHFAPVKALMAEFDRAEERERAGEPAHLVEMIARLSRLAIARNTAIEEIMADDKDQSIRELERLSEDVRRIATQHVRTPRRRRQLEAEIDARFAAASFPFRHDRLIPRITVAGSVADVSLDPGLRAQKPWTVEDKRALIQRGYDLADAELRAAGVDERSAA